MKKSKFAYNVVFTHSSGAEVKTLRLEEPIEFYPEPNLKFTEIIEKLFGDFDEELNYIPQYECIDVCNAIPLR